jgi:hypothetical protein
MKKILLAIAILISLASCKKDHPAEDPIIVPGCAATPGISIDYVTNSMVSLYWSRVLPTAAGGYDWELRNGSNAITLQSGNVLAPGGTMFLTITGLTTGTSYVFRVRTVCAVGSYSPWTNISFTTQ